MRLFDQGFERFTPALSLTEEELKNTLNYQWKGSTY